MTDDTNILRTNPPGGKRANVRVSRSRPCLTCGKPDWCLISQDGRESLCARVADGATRTIKTRDGGELHVHPLNAEQRRNHLPPPPSKPRAGRRTADELERIHAEYLNAAEINPEPLAKLADYWGVRIADLKGAGAGVYGRNACAFPELDPLTHRICGFQYKLPGSKKKWGIEGGSRGFVYDLANLKNGDGPAVIVEGYSDYVAARGMGLRVIGRWNNKADVPPCLLAECGNDTKFIFICERDEKPNGSQPGLTGPMDSAKAAANATGKTMFCAFPPDCGSAYKDTREYLNGEQAKSADPYHFDFKAAGRKFIEGLTETMIAVEPDPAKPAPRYFPLLNLGAAKRVDDSVREQKRRERVKSIITKATGVYVDTDPSSAGGLTAAIHAAKSTTARVTIITDSQQTCGEVVEMGGEGFAGFSSRDIGNCQNYGEIQKAQRYGLPTSVCRTTCKFSDGCLYWQEVEKAANARVSVASSIRGGWQWDALSAGREAIFIEGNAEQVLRPIREGVRDDFESAVAILTWVVANTTDVGLSNEMREFSAECLIVAKGIVTKFTEAEAAQKVVKLNTVKRFHGDCGNWKDSMWLAIQAASTRSDDNGNRIIVPCGSAIEIIGDLVLGRLVEASIIAGWTEAEAAYMAANPFKAQPQLVAVSQNEIPDAVVWASDPSTTGYKLERLIGRPIDDRTLGFAQLNGENPIRPSSRLKTKQPVIQVARSIYIGTKSRPVCSYLRGVLTRHPAARRVGVIGHKHHIEDMFTSKKALLDKASRNRVARFSWFGGGDVRNSNSWRADCDLLVILGTPIRPMQAMRAKLVQLGKSDAADRNGGRGEYVWEGWTVDGDPVDVSKTGFSDPDWQEVYQSTTQADLRIAVDLAHPYSDVGGIPVVVVTCEPLGYPVADDHWLEPIKEPVVRAVETLISLDNACTTAEIAKGMRQPERTVRRYLDAARDLGWVTYARGKRWWIDSGWYDFRPKTLKYKENISKQSWPEVAQGATALPDTTPSIATAASILVADFGQAPVAVPVTTRTNAPEARTHAGEVQPDSRPAQQRRAFSVNVAPPAATAGYP